MHTHNNERARGDSGKKENCLRQHEPVETNMVQMAGLNDLAALSPPCLSKINRHQYEIDFFKSTLDYAKQLSNYTTNSTNRIPKNTKQIVNKN